MRFRLTLPDRVLVDTQIDSLQAEDASGRFGIREGHEAFLTALVPSVLVWRPRSGSGGRGRGGENFAAIRSGVLRVQDGQVSAAVRWAQVSQSLDDMEGEVSRKRQRNQEEAAQALTSLYQMQLSAWRKLMDYKNEE